MKSTFSMKHVLLGTDILLDFFFDRKPYSSFTAQVLTLCETKKIKGYVTPVILSNMYYLLKRDATHDKVVEKLAQLVSITEILLINRASVLLALNSNFRDFEDALQNFAAVDNKDVEIILTRNHKDYKGSSLSVMSPEEYMMGYLIK